MGIRSTTPRGAVATALNLFRERATEAVVYQLKQIGEEVRNAQVELMPGSGQGRGSYTDRSGNLRSSIGYVIIVNGRIRTKAGFGAKGANEGQSQGETTAESFAAKFPDKTALVVVAGMNYAVYVAEKNFDVLDTAYIKAKQIVPKMLKELGIRKNSIK